MNLKDLVIYPSFAKVAFTRQAKFRLANISGLFTNTFFMLFRTSVFTAIYEHSSEIAGYTLAQSLSYAVLVQALIMVIPQWGSIGVGEDIRTGQVAMDLCRPLNYYLMILFKRIGISGFFLLGRGIPALLIGYSFGFLTIFPDKIASLWGVVSLILGVWLANSLHFLVELTGFWLENSRGPKMLVVGLTYFFSGATIPVVLFPPWAQTINLWLPFSYTLNAPIEILLGVKNPLDLFLPQLLWVIVISGFCLVVLKQGERKVVLHGG